MQFVTLLLLLMFGMGVVLGAGLVLLWNLLRKFGTMLVLELDPSTDNYALTYRRPNNKFMGIRRGKEEASVPLEEAQIWSPTASMDGKPEGPKVPKPKDTRPFWQRWSPNPDLNKAIEDARGWQKRGGNQRMKMIIVDGDTGLPLKKFDAKGARNLWPNGYDLKRILEAPLVREFVQKDTDNSRLMILMVGIVALAGLAGVIYLIVQFGHLAAGIAASQAGGGHA